MHKRLKERFIQANLSVEMNIFCPTPPNLCFDPADPTNPGPSSLFPKYSAEDPDKDIFIGRNYRPFPDFPPLGSNWTAVGCVGWCLSTISQEDANLCAQRQAAMCVAGDWPVEIANPTPAGNRPPDSPDFIPRPRELFPNQEQSATFTCPDGSPFTFTVAAGTFLALSQVAANLMALSYATNQAVVNRLCFGPISNDGCCVGNVCTSVITISSGNTPLTLTIASGSLPSGLLMQQNETQAIISGEATAVGTYTFMLQAMDSKGHTMQKQYTIYVEGIVNTSLPPATVGSPYSATLLPDGPTSGSITWNVLLGSLPSGLTLDINTGIISGTPTSTGISTFTILMTDNRVDCQEQFTITVSEGGLNFNNLEWTNDVVLQAGITGDFTADGNSASTEMSVGSGVPAGQAHVSLVGTLHYTGIERLCNLHVSVDVSFTSSFSTTECRVVVYQDGNPLVDQTVNPDFNPPGAQYDFPFTIIQSINSEIIVTLLATGEKAIGVTSDLKVSILVTPAA